MLFETKLFRNVNKIFYTLKERLLVVQNSFSLALFALFLGFLCGNLFGTFLDTLRVYFIWNGFVAFIILLFIEMINFFVYKISLTEKINTNLPLAFNKTRGFQSLARVTPKGWLYSPQKGQSNSRGYNIKVQRKGRDVRFAGVSETSYIERSMNAFKIGLLFGFFIDSFKVGS